MEERLAGRDLQRLRVAIPGRATLHDVADVHVLAAPADGLDHLREQLARAADEWPAALVLFLARALADEDDARVGVSLAEDHAAPLLAQRAAPAVADLGADRVEQRQLRDGRVTELCRSGERRDARAEARRRSGQGGGSRG